MSMSQHYILVYQERILSWVYIVIELMIIIIKRFIVFIAPPPLGNISQIETGNRKDGK